VNTCIQVPAYDSRRRTSDAFLKKFRSYFAARGSSPKQFHEILPMTFKGEYNFWYDSVISEINLWEDFVGKFKSRFDNNETLETFIYEVVSYSKEIAPHDSNEVPFKRALRLCRCTIT